MPPDEDDGLGAYVMRETRLCNLVRSRLAGWCWCGHLSGYIDNYNLDQCPSNWCNNISSCCRYRYPDPSALGRLGRRCQWSLNDITLFIGVFVFARSLCCAARCLSVVTAGRYTLGFFQTFLPAFWAPFNGPWMGNDAQQRHLGQGYEICHIKKSWTNSYTYHFSPLLRIFCGRLIGDALTLDAYLPAFQRLPIGNRSSVRWLATERTGAGAAFGGICVDRQFKHLPSWVGIRFLAIQRNNRIDGWWNWLQSFMAWVMKLSFRSVLFILTAITRTLNICVFYADEVSPFGVLDFVKLPRLAGDNASQSGCSLPTIVWSY